MRLIPIAIATACLALGACTQQAVQTTFDPPYPERNAAGDPILAVFEGRVPCEVPDCRVLKVSLVLYGRAKRPTTYWLGTVSVGIDSDRVVAQGTWTVGRGVDGYPNAVVYRLDRQADERVRRLWRLNDNIAMLLDANMRPKSGDASWGGYSLSRDTAPYGPRTYPYDEHKGRFLFPGERVAAPLQWRPCPNRFFWRFV
jgi:hypothetical protein